MQECVYGEEVKVEVRQVFGGSAPVFDNHRKNSYSEVISRQSRCCLPHQREQHWASQTLIESGRSLRALPLRNRFSIGCPNIYISNIDLYAQIHAATLEIGPFIIRSRILQLQPDLRPSVTIRM